jgi:hypothetical protein
VTRWIGRRRQPVGPTDEEGIYLLANDAVVPWLTACAASLRHFNPSLRVVVIAFDGELEQVRPLCTHHGFQLWRDESLSWFDQLADALTGERPVQLFRKLATFSGPLARFVYVDVDTLVLTDLRLVLDAIAARPDAIQFAHCGAVGGNVDAVYRPGAWRENFLARHGTNAANGGIWGAWREALSRTQLTDLAEAARPIADQLVDGDQAFLNYCLDATGTPVANLHDRIEAQMVWAGVPGYVPAGRELRDPNGPPIGLVHWAGFALDPAMPYRDVWERWASADPVVFRPARSGLARQLRRVAHT